MQQGTTKKQTKKSTGCNFLMPPLEPSFINESHGQPVNPQLALNPELQPSSVVNKQPDQQAV